MNDFADYLRATLAPLRLRSVKEADVGNAIADALAADGIAFEREARLSPKDRIDFLCPGGVGLEVKVDGRLGDVTRQLHRYAQSERVTLLVLVSSCMRLITIPRELNGKRVDFIHMAGGAF